LTNTTAPFSKPFQAAEPIEPEGKNLGTLAAVGPKWAHQDVAFAGEQFQVS
jgi:hypothetical protein